MATATKFNSSRIAARAKSPAARSVFLPEKANVPPGSLLDYCITLYGVKGVGKTSLFGHQKDTKTLMLEPRRRNLKIHQWPEGGPQPSWEEVQEFVDLCVEHGPPLTVVVDTADEARSICERYYAKKAGYDDPQVAGEALPYGNFWVAVREGFAEVFNKLLYSDIGLVFTSHAKLRDSEAIEEGSKVIAPTASPACWKYLKAVSDYAFYYGYHGNDRAIWVRGDDQLWAACGVDDHFMDAKTGLPLKAFKVGNTPQEAYKTLMAAFDNKVTDIVTAQAEKSAERAASASKFVKGKK